MKVLMLGWEYPPHISGGLGTACEGLTVGLARKGVPITFVVPHLFGGEKAPHMRLLEPQNTGSTNSSYGTGSDGGESLRTESATYKSILKTVKVPAALSPYWTAENYQTFLASVYETRAANAKHFGIPFLSESQSAAGEVPLQSQPYGHDIFDEVARYAVKILDRFSDSGTYDFDVVHAHDWMTYPAGVAISLASGKPLVAHVHSIERDRSGAGANQRIADIERYGLTNATRVIAVSHYTKNLIQREYGIPEENINVVHNGVYAPKVISEYKRQKSLPTKVVLFLGRVTFQKGPDYFVEAAAKVIPFVPDVLFVMAGSGDMLQPMIQRVRELGIERHFFFTGFLKGQEVEQMFSLADVYVMPSVSEPFGISALEAVNYNTPVIVSKQSGVSEVLSHALKVDFWDIDRLADLIISSLEHEELREDMVRMAREEIKRLQWDESAKKTIEVYRELLN